MQPFVKLTAAACPLPLSNVDTDQLIPARFMSRPRSAGYGEFLLHDLRRDAAGAPDPAFPVNAHAGARILVARRNFGCGSSREAAVYALADFGFACVIAPSFGDIFASNAVNNGLLPATVEEAEAEALLGALETGGDLTVDLEAQEIRGAGAPVRFSVDPVWRTKLLNGWDDVDLTLSHAQAIAAFARTDAEARPWAQLPEG